MASAKKVLLLTGGNAGLGYEAIKALYASSHHYELLVGSRSVSKGEEAVAQLKKEISQSSSNLSVLQVDLSSDDSINAALKEIESKYGHLDVLVNNGGAGFDGEIAKGSMSIREAFNASWDTNVSGTQVLTYGALPLLLKSKDPRLLFLTSGTSSLVETERQDLPMFQRLNASPAAGWPKEAGINPITSYRSTKTGLNMLMREWHRILLKDSVKVWAISPGFLATGLGGVGKEQLKKMGAQEPSVGGEFIRDVVEGKRDNDVGKVIRKDMIQPW